MNDFATDTQFLAVQNSSIGDLVPWLVGWTQLTLSHGLLLFDIKERPERLVTFQTFHQRDEET